MGLAVLIGLCAHGTALAAGRRVALVIGISQYQSVPSLANPRTDAEAVAKALSKDGFEVTQLTRSEDLGRTALWAAISAFRRSATGAEAAIIYYAGHGVETGGRNWLLPADAKADTPDEIDGSAIASSTLITAVSGAIDVRLVILDACRDNPFASESGWSQGTRSIATTRGLARENNLPPNVVVLLATQPGLKANDGNGGANSPFARALASALTTEGLRLSSLPTLVSRQMRQLSGIDQRPDQQGIFDAPDWMFQPGSTSSLAAQPRSQSDAAAAAPAQLTSASAAPAPPPAEPVPVARGYGLVLQGRGYGQPGLYVADVAAGSPFDGTLHTGDVILKFNSVTPVGPQGVISALDRDRRASVNLQHDGLGVPISIQLVLPKDTDE
ncbi:caspase family protein [Novosphingobium sp.]|uniref:caspase family protein n=1 Tax=Novosphingobium sp. TaxID=1874826 RepID=UPI003BADA9DD